MTLDLSNHRRPQDFKIATIASFILSIYGNVRYLVGRGHLNDVPFHVHDTPFTANILMTIGYWIVTYVMQVIFLSNIFVPSEDSLVSSGEVSKISVHFMIFNILQFVWNYLFAHKYWFVSEIVAILNFLNILGLYFSHRTYRIAPFKKWFSIHMPVSALPLSWLFYVIFWNGVVLFNVHKFVGRVICNVLIWDFLIVPGMFLFLFGDYGVGFSSAYILFALSVGQFFTKVFALQWIFALIIGSLLVLLSIVVAVSPDFRAKKSIPDGEAAPLIAD